MNLGLTAPAIRGTVSLSAEYLLHNDGWKSVSISVLALLLAILSSPVFLYYYKKRQIVLEEPMLIKRT
ncbi:MAG TPA: hypothetical protein ENJ08_13720 [Gammaproteobacteria bacterium]|nr:hypothetical protein [Gammaproteobacteria bacterium]